jgi:hypothetical protein
LRTAATAAAACHTLKCGRRQTIVLPRRAAGREQCVLPCSERVFVATNSLELAFVKAPQALDNTLLIDNVGIRSALAAVTLAADQIVQDNARLNG